MLGVCYYPEHWPEAIWAEDARRMAGLGLSVVRIGEFAWSRLEPEPGVWNFAWLDRAIETLAGAGLKLVLGTPTATPPKWLIDRHPEILPVDPETGRVRGFGSRRHYDFSSPVYRAEALRITEALALRYGAHAAVIGWQTDNELCCHDTTLSGSPAAQAGFQRWLAARYGEVAALNEAWGNVFWSMEYRSFEEIELPILAVTETNPAHRLAFRRYASDQVLEFHAAQVEAIRARAPGRFITHNFIPPHETGVDCFALAAGLDFASYDNYPLGRTDLAMARAPAEAFRPYMRTGHPDAGAMFFDQTRGLQPSAPFWVMEQQPGPVNWARHNPRPAPGMVRLWTLEAFAHGAGCVSYFRWRQVPFAQEQMHAGLLRPDNAPAAAWPEVERARAEIQALNLAQEPTGQAPVAILLDVESQWLAEIERQGVSYAYPEVFAEYYEAARRLGLDLDVIGPEQPCQGYQLILVPALAMPSATTVARLAESGAALLFGPRSGAKTKELRIPDGLPPGPLRALAPLVVSAVETLRPDCPEELVWRGERFEAGRWLEGIEPLAGEVQARFQDGTPALLRQNQVLYLAALTEPRFLEALIASLCAERGVASFALPEGLRLRRRGRYHFAFNYAESEVEVPAPPGAAFVLGGRRIAPRDVAVWQEPAA